MSWRAEQMASAKRDAAPVRMIGFPSDGGLVTAGVTNTTILGLSAVVRCLDIITNGVSQLEWREVKNGADWPISRIVKRPHPDMTRRDWTSFVTACIALHDRSFWLKTGGEDSEGVPINLLPLEPSYVQASDVTSLQMISPMPADEYWVGQVKIGRDQLVIVNRGLLPGISEAAMGIIKLARIKFAEALAADAYSSRYWQAGGPMGRALLTDSNPPDKVVEDLSDRWGARRAIGPDKWAILTNGLKPWVGGVDPTAQSAVEARRELVADIGRFFGIPTHSLNAPAGDSETYSSTEASNQDLTRYTLQNYIGAIQDGISDLLPGGRMMLMKSAPLSYGTYLARAQAYQLATGGKAWMTPEDVREELDLPPVEDPEALNPPPPAPVVAEPAGGNPNG